MTTLSSRLVAMAAMLLLVPVAHATPTLSFSVDGGQAITCADGAACDLSSDEGLVTTIQYLGGFNISITTGVTKPLIENPLMDLNSINIQTSIPGNHTLVIGFSETDFVNSSLDLTGLFGGTLLAAPGSSVNASAYLDTSNALFGEATPIGSLAFGPGAFSGTFSGDGAGTTTPYSLTQALTLSFKGPGVFSGDFALQTVPEPASLALLGIGLIGLGFSRRKRA